MANNTEKPEEKEGFAAGPGEGALGFLQRNRKPLGIFAAAAFILVTGLIAAFGIRESLSTADLRAADGYYRRYEALRDRLKEPALETEVKGLLDDLSRFTGKRRSGYAAARAYFTLAGIYAGQEDWARAEASWRSAARAGANSYLAPAALFNAAAAAEEQGNGALAIELYTQCLDLKDRFPPAPRAQFSIGRLREAEGNPGAALEAYNELLRRWPNDQIWAGLAQDRIIALNAGNP